MATTPQPPAKPAAPPPAATSPAPHAKTEPAAKRAEPDPPARTIADEQRERSQDYEDRGVEVVKAEGDQRDEADKPKQVAGVAKVEGGTPGRSTPEARAAQHRSAP